MSGHAYFSSAGTLEYELRCDGCGALFRCHDDSYYCWPILCDAAEAEGWQVTPDDHRCDRCAPVAEPSVAAFGGGRLAAT